MRIGWLIAILTIAGCVHKVEPSYFGNEHLQNIEANVEAAVPHTDAEGKKFLATAKDEITAEKKDKAEANKAVQELKDDNAKKDERIAIYQERWTGDKLQHLIRMVMFGLAGTLVVFLVGFVVVKLLRRSPVGIAEDALGSVIGSVTHVVSNKEEKFFRDVPP